MSRISINGNISGSTMLLLISALSLERSSAFSSSFLSSVPSSTYQVVKKYERKHPSVSSPGIANSYQKEYRGGPLIAFMSESNNEGHGEISDESRRNLLISSSLLVQACFPLCFAKSALAADDNLLDLDQKKVVMQMSSENIPKKYSSSSTITASTSANTSVPPQLDELTEIELRRIAVFEKAAPSVVYIDTFVEQRDVFSTNVMEVPVGTGSGFVWDDKGHIVTNCESFVTRHSITQNSGSRSCHLILNFFMPQNLTLVSII